MGSHDLPARDLPRLRRGAHKFLRGLAAHAWEHQNEFGRWEITLPPDVAVLPEHQRFRVHAKQEAPRDPSHDRRTKEGTHAVTQIDFAYFNFEHVLSAYLPCPFLAGPGRPAGRLAAELRHVPFTAARTMPR